MSRSSSASFHLPNGLRPPRALWPFWLQLFTSFAIILALIGGTIALLWPAVQWRIFILPRAFQAMSAAESAAQFYPVAPLYEIDPSDAARRRAPYLPMLQRIVSAQGVEDVRTRRREVAEAMRARAEAAASEDLFDPARALRTDASSNSDFQDFILEFHIAVPGPDGWIYWLSTNPALIDQPVPYARYLEAYAEGPQGWDNFIDASGLFRIYFEDDDARIAELAAERGALNPPPRDGFNALRDSLVSARSLSRRIDPLAAAALLQGTGVDLTKAVLISEYPRERTMGATYILRVIFVGILALAVLVALAAAIVLTWHINQPIGRLARAMSAISAGDHKVRVGAPYARNELGRLAWHFDAMMDQYESSRELSEGVAIAARIQRGLIPDPPERLGNLEIAAWYEPSSQVGGDFYDFVVKERRLYIIVADAVGHGIDSGLVMASARAMVRTLLETVSSPGELLTRLNKLLARDFRDGNFMTTVVAQIDLERMELTISSAGHEPVLMTASSLATCRLLKAAHPPLGVFPELVYVDQPPVPLRPGDVVVFSSDGIRECHNAADELFGMKRFSETVCGATGSAAKVVEALQESLKRHAGDRPVEDDISLVAVRATDGTAEACQKS
ncbi:MAG: SpoIIE family protein phosphatase [Candidatus Sumerlaeia bacterium]|nr:SpoIIE family protein phosphatase [Candidatus Sumerlaeia bacterium]